MEQLRFLNRVIDISEPILAEDSTFSRVALSLSAVLEQLDENAIHHDYLVALLSVLLAESGFCILSISNNSLKRDQNTRLVYIPADWKLPETGIYKIHFILRNLENIQSKLIAIPFGDKLIINIFPCIKEKKTYSMIIQTLKYVNPYSNNPSLRYMNLKEISHRFKDKLTTPLRTDILSLSGLISPSFQGLPIELRLIIVNMLRPVDLQHLALCSKEFYEFCLDSLLLTKLKEYAGDGSRKYVEGEKVLNANHLMYSGIIEQCNSCVEILFLCLQSSDLYGKPHEIKVHIKTINNNNVIQSTCTCKARTLGKCKHVVAALIHLTRYK